MGLPLGEARAMERARAFAHYRAMPASDFKKMRAFVRPGETSGGDGRARPAAATSKL